MLVWCRMYSNAMVIDLLGPLITGTDFCLTVMSPPPSPQYFRALPLCQFSPALPTTPDELYLMGTNATLVFPQLRPKHCRLPQHPQFRRASARCRWTGRRVTPIRSLHATPRNTTDPPSHGSRRLWHDSVLSGSINDFVLLTSLSHTLSNESSAERRVAVSKNDCTVKFFDVYMRGAKGVDGPPKRISEAGMLRLDIPVNHLCVVSPLNSHS
jgi:hypothetical protein